MRILLTANASYAPPRGGATRSNLVWLNHLASRGHACRIVCGPAGEGAQFRRHESIGLLPVEDPARLLVVLREQIREFRPDWVLVSSEDVGHVLLREAQHSAEGRLVYLAHTPQFFPFGPASWNPDLHAAEMVARAAGIVVIGRHMAQYVERALGRVPEIIHPPIYGPGPFPYLADFARGLTAMINPCAVKGISIFLGVAERLPAQAFGATPGWGTTAEDRRALARLPNVRVLPNPHGIDELLRETRLLLMPSLWYEGFGLIVMEAMLRGIPVVSSDAGGLVEARCGTGFVIPVRPIERYEPVFDEHGMPAPVTPPQEIGPWVDAVHALITDQGRYERASRAARAAALRFVAGLRGEALEELLAGLAPPAETPVPAARTAVENLSAERRALLLQRLRKA